MSGYALLGATWIILKAENALQRRMQNYAWYLGVGTLVFIGVVSIMTPFQDPEYFQRWLNLPGSIFSVIMPGAVLAASLGAVYRPERG